MKWTIKEIDFIKNNKHLYTCGELSKILGRSKESVEIKVHRLNIKIKKIVNETLVCKNCGKEFEAKISAKAKFCSSSCSATYSNLSRDKSSYNKSSESLKEYWRKQSLSPRICEKICVNCEKKFTKEYHKRKPQQKHCSKECRNESSSKKISKAQKELAKDLSRRLFLKDIGRKGGFGEKGYVSGIRYDSKFEKICFQFLIDHNIEFIPHKVLENSSKVSDLYLPKLNLYVELDGINREKRKYNLKSNYDRWLDKLSIYKSENLEYIIIYNFEEFKNMITRNYNIENKT